MSHSSSRARAKHVSLTHTAYLRRFLFAGRILLQTDVSGFLETTFTCVTLVSSAPCRVQAGAKGSVYMTQDEPSGSLKGVVHTHTHPPPTQRFGFSTPPRPGGAFHQVLLGASVSGGKGRNSFFHVCSRPSPETDFLCVCAHTLCACVCVRCCVTMPSSPRAGTGASIVE